MKKYVVEFVKRGLVFGGFGPIIAGIVYLVLEFSVEGFSLSGVQVFLAIVSTYLMAFLQAGASVFNQIEGWPLVKSLACHLTTYYVSYVGCYLLNSWLPFSVAAIGIFTAVFVGTYFIIWLSVYFSIKTVAKKMNKNLA